EDRHGTDRNEHAADIGTGSRRSTWQGTIDPRLDPGALSHQPGEYAQLIDGAPPLSDKAWHRQCSLDVCALDDAVVGLELGGNVIEKCRARLTGNGAIGVEGLCCDASHVFDECARGFLECGQSARG